MKNEMREILFRGKSRVSHEWVYGLLVGVPQDISSFFTEYAEIFDLETHETYTSIISETVGQFINLFDMNGTKIFEGDIVEWFLDIGATKHIAFVEYKLGGFVYTPLSGRDKNKVPHASCLVDEKKIKVIGNIYDSLELTATEAEALAAIKERF